MTGFYAKTEEINNKEEKPKKKRTKKAPVHPCDRCKLYQNCLHPKQKVFGRGRKKALIILGSPSQFEDKTGRPFCDEAGKIFIDAVEQQGYDLRRDFWVTYAVTCRAHKNNKDSKPTKMQKNMCKQNMVSTIQELEPTSIILVGETAVDSFLSAYHPKRFKSSDSKGRAVEGKWNGFCIPDKEVNAWVLPMYHPDFVLQHKDGEHVWSRDFKLLLENVDIGRPTFEDDSQYVKILWKYEEVLALFDRVQRCRSVVTFDYETNHLNPYKKKSKILTNAIKMENDKYSYAFVMEWKDYWTPAQLKEIKRRWAIILSMPNIKKNAQNLKFEERWGRGILNAPTKGWIWDTQLATHLMDERPGIVSLKFQAFIYWGIDDYDSYAKEYMKKTDEEGYNLLETADLEKILTYNALDSLYEERLMHCQQRDIDKPTTKAYNFFHDILLAFCDMEGEGFPVDEEYYQSVWDEITVKIDRIFNKLNIGRELRLYKEKTGEDFDWGNTGGGSTKALKILFYDVLGYDPVKYTEKGQVSIDAEALGNLDSRFADRLLTLRKLKKIRDTYISQFIRHGVNNHIYASMNLHIARTYRTSMSDPNLQNIPKHDDFARRIIRSGIKPEPGCLFTAHDFSAAEARIIASVSGDKNLIQKTIEGYDIHKSCAADLYLLPDELIDKNIRFWGKNDFVFAEFYGSFYIACAHRLWKDGADYVLKNGKTIRQHLKDEGVISKDDNAYVNVERWYGGKEKVLKQLVEYEELVKVVEEDFWEEFSGVRAWQKKVLADYKKKGFIQMKFGHQRRGYLSRNKVYNSGIQGTAAHCLLWCMARVNEDFKKNCKSRPILQIHDEIINNVFPDELDYCVSTTERIMTKDLSEYCKWLKVPMEVGTDIGKVDESWYLLG